MLAIESLPFILAVLSFLFISLLSMGIFHLVSQSNRKKYLLNKIRLSSAPSVKSNLEDPEDTKSQRNLINIFLNFLGSLGKKVIPDTLSEDYTTMRLRFLKAGIRHPNVLAPFWGAKCLLAVILVLVFLILESNFHFLTSPRYYMLICIGLALAGFYLPDFWLKERADSRKKKVEYGFPDALDLMVICVEAGMGLDAAMNRVAKEIRHSYPILSDELGMVGLEIKAGKSRKQALNNLSLRTDLEEVKNFAGLMIQTMEFGTSVADTLRVYSDSFRTKRRQKAEEKAAKLPLKMLFPTLLFIFPALFVVLLGPAVINILKSFSTLR